MITTIRRISDTTTERILFDSLIYLFISIFVFAISDQVMFGLGKMLGLILILLVSIIMVLQLIVKGFLNPYTRFPLIGILLIISYKIYTDGGIELFTGRTKHSASHKFPMSISDAKSSAISYLGNNPAYFGINGFDYVPGLSNPSKGAFMFNTSICIGSTKSDCNYRGASVSTTNNGLTWQVNFW